MPIAAPKQRKRIRTTDRARPCTRAPRPPRRTPTALIVSAISAKLLYKTIGKILSSINSWCNSNKCTLKANNFILEWDYPRTCLILDLLAPPTSIALPHRLFLPIITIPINIMVKVPLNKLIQTRNMRISLQTNNWLLDLAALRMSLWLPADILLTANGTILADYQAIQPSSKDMAKTMQLSIPPTRPMANTWVMAQ